MNITGNRIRELRTKNDLTLDDVARHLGVGRQAIYKYEQGTVTNIPLENLEKMADLFGVSPGYLAGWTDHDPLEEIQEALVDLPVPKTPEARIMARGIDRLPPAEREQALAVVRAMFNKYADYFDRENDNES